MVCFTDASYQLTGNLQEVDHIGPQSIEKLNKQGIYTTYQLLGHFLWLDRDKTAFLALLKSARTPAAHREAVAEAVSKRVAEVGIIIGVTLPTHVDGTPVSSRLDEAKAKNIKNIKFNNDLRHDFPGVGFGNESDTTKNVTVKKLTEYGIENTDHLFGEMLRHFDQSPPAPDDLGKFWKKLGELGCAHGWKTTIIAAMIAKLDVGIGDCETEEPGTEERTRYTRSRLEPSAEEAEAASRAREAIEEAAREREEARMAERALHAYEAFFDLPNGSATLDQVQATSAGIAGFSTAEFSDWARRFHDDATAGPREELTQAEGRAEGAERERAAALDTIADTKARLADSQAELEQLRRQATAETAALKAEVREATAETAALKAEVREATAEADARKAEVREATAEADALKAEVRKGRRLIVLVSLTFALLAYVTLAAAEQLPGWFATASIPPELSAPAITLVVVLHVVLLIGGAIWALRLRLGPSPGFL